MKRGVLRVVATAAVALGAAGVTSAAVSAYSAGVAAPAGFYEGKLLEPAASYVAKKPVVVWCAKTQAGWRETLAPGAGEIDGLAVPGSSAMRLNPLVCQVIDLWATGQQTPAYAEEGFAEAIETVTHEAVHLRGESDEGVTDCAAMHEMPRVAVRFFHVGPYKQLRALMAAAWGYHRQKPAPYKTLC